MKDIIRLTESEVCKACILYVGDKLGYNFYEDDELPEVIFVNSLDGEYEVEIVLDEINEEDEEEDENKGENTNKDNNIDKTLDDIDIVSKIFKD